MKKFKRTTTKELIDSCDWRIIEMKKGIGKNVSIHVESRRTLVSFIRWANASYVNRLLKTHGVSLSLFIK